MSDRQSTDEVRTIHPRALEALGLEAATVMLGVARDLRSGVIRPEHYDQKNWIIDSDCGTACCIAGHVATRLGVRKNHAYFDAWADKAMGKDIACFHLFSGRHPSDPLLAADAIERYIYDGADRPWDVPKVA